MHRRKSPRHVRAARARWRAAEARADAARAEGVTDIALPVDARDPIHLDLRKAGGPLWCIEPRIGYIAWRLVDESGKVHDCAALKTLLHRIADKLPRTLSMRSRT